MYNLALFTVHCQQYAQCFYHFSHCEQFQFIIFVHILHFFLSSDIFLQLFYIFLIPADDAAGISAVFALYNAFFFLYIYQYNITTDLFYVTPVNHILFFSAKAPEKFSRDRNDQCSYNSFTGINIHICHKSQPFAVPYINYFTIFYFT